MNCLFKYLGMFVLCQVTLLSYVVKLVVSGVSRSFEGLRYGSETVGTY